MTDLYEEHKYALYYYSIPIDKLNIEIVIKQLLTILCSYIIE